MKRIKHLSFRRIVISCTIASASVLLTSCNDFLNIVPDDIPTWDHAFSNAKEAEKVLFTCYAYIPQAGSPAANIGLTAGDEVWLPLKREFKAPAWDNIARGQVSTESVLPNFWNGSDWAHHLFVAIRTCNTFLAKIEDTNQVSDLSTTNRARWIAEAKFLKAYYNFYLLRYYGPIPIIDTEISVSAEPSEVQVKRESIDYCVQYISDLLDASFTDLPLVISNTQNEMGRITKPINRALKAKLLLMAASPLFNGNEDYANFRNIDGTLFFNQAEDINKWVKAAEAAREALDVVRQAGADRLYTFTLSEPGWTMEPASIVQMSLRQAVCERWNSEIIWGLSGAGARAGETIQQACMPGLDASMSVSKTMGCMAPPMHIVKQFYTKNGVPTKDDITLDFSKPEALRTAVASEAINMETGYTTARINFDREPRFYAYIGFDGGKFLMQSNSSRSDVGNYVVRAKLYQLANPTGTGSRLSRTGYFIKKLIHWKSGFTNSTSAIQYAWPEIRLADLYLMYAEALNEAYGPSGDADGTTDDSSPYTWLNRVRERAGIPTVGKAWNDFTANPGKPKTQAGLRDIIRQERMNELAFEGCRYWDLLRWKLAEDYLNTPITGWDYLQSEAEAYYVTRTVDYRQFVAPRDYFMPIQNAELRVNPKLVQNPGWK